MASMSIDASEARRVAVDLSSAGARVSKGLRPAVLKGAVNIKKQLRAEMRASKHFKGAAGDIDFSTVTTFGQGGSIEAQIGPHSGRGTPGAIANVAYFGTSRGGGTVPDPKLALAAEVPRLEAALLALLRGIL